MGLERNTANHNGLAELALCCASLGGCAYLEFPQHGPHPNREGLDLTQALQGFGINVGLIQEEELGLGEEGR
jgi:hypothetical protein